MFFSLGFKSLSAMLSLALLAKSKPIQPFPRALNSSMGMHEHLSSSEIHARVMQNWPSDLITTSTERDQYIDEHGLRELNVSTTLYLRDVAKFWTITGQINDTATNSIGLDKRQTACPCSIDYQYTVLGSQSMWSPWQSLSSCTTSNNGGGGSVSYTSSKSVTYSYSVGAFAGDGWLASISASFSYSVGTTTGFSVGYSCDFTADQDAAQVWGRTWLGIAAMKQDTYNNCAGCGLNGPLASSTGAVITPAQTTPGSSLAQFGCTTQNDPTGYLTGCSS